MIYVLHQNSDDGRSFQKANLELFRSIHLKFRIQTAWGPMGINIRHHYNKIEGLKHLWRNYGVIIWDLWPLKTQYLEIFQNIYEEIVINISSHEHFLPETSFPLIRACHFLSFKRKSMFHFSRFQIFIRLFWSLG